MARAAVAVRGVRIRLACAAFAISETCYRYEPKLSDENAEICEWLLRLTQAQRNWGFGLCYLCLRNVKCLVWNHKRVYRIYRELELNLRIKPKKRLKREVPETLAVPVAINEVCSMDFMHDRLSDERVMRTLAQIIEWCGAPKVIRCDNGPEYVSGAVVVQSLASERGARRHQTAAEVGRSGLGLLLRPIKNERITYSIPFHFIRYFFNNI